MYDNLARRAIMAALANDWQSALDANLAILADEPDDPDALNRSAKAYLQLGEIKKAIKHAQKVLNIDPVNPIAVKCISKCEALLSEGTNTPSDNKLDSPDSVFLEIPGRTKIVSLINLCESVTLAKLDAGHTVKMIPRSYKVAVVTNDEVYIGRLPDDLATRLIHFIKNGNEYDTYIKSISDQNVKVFIREVKRSPSLNNTPSFPLKSF